MSQAVEFPNTEMKFTNASKCDMLFNRMEPLYETWSHNVTSFLKSHGVVHHLKVNDTAAVRGKGDLKATQEFNQLVVHQFLNWNIHGNVKLRVISATVQGKPTLVWKMMKAMYSMVSAARAEQYREELH